MSGRCSTPCRSHSPASPPSRSKRPPLRALDEALEVPPLDAAPVPAVPDADPAVVVPVAVDDVDCAAVAGVVFAPVVVAGRPAALLPSVTTPRFVTLYGFAVVCAKAGAMAAKRKSAA